MSEQANGQEPFSFRKFLESNTNLLTVFAIFNALIVFSISIKESEVVRDILTISFWIFSLLTFLELLVGTFKTYQVYRLNISFAGKIKLSLFFYAVIFTQLSLIAYFALLYPYVVGWLLLCCLAVGSFLLLVWVNISIDELISKSKEKRGWSSRTFKILRKINNWSLLLIMILIGLVIFYLRYWIWQPPNYPAYRFAPNLVTISKNVLSVKFPLRPLRESLPF